MVTAYGPLPTPVALLTAPEQRADNEAVTADTIDWPYLTELFGHLAGIPADVPVHVDGPAEPNLCGGSACLDGDECDAEYVITHRAVGGLLIYRTPVCRGCLPIEVNHLSRAHGTDPASIVVHLPAPLIEQTS
jgi:hypothetical protein